MNLGTLSLLIFFFNIKILFMIFVLYPLSKCFKRISITYKKVKRDLFFNDFFTLIFEGYFNIVLCCFYNLSAPNDSLDKNSTNTSISIMLMLILIVLIPASLVYIIVQPLTILESEQFKSTWGKAYTDIRFKSKFNMLYRLFFCLRRTIFIFSIYQLYNYQTLQICLFYYSNLLVSIYQG